MNPILYSQTETDFENNGIGVLSDAIFCEVTEARNGEYFLTMEYPQTGTLYSELQYDRIILAKPNDTAQAQPFRITLITEPINKIATVEADHVSYQTSGITVMPFSAEGIGAAVAGMIENSTPQNPFSFSTDKATAGIFSVPVPRGFRGLLGGEEGSLLDIFGGGEYEFDRWAITLHQERGADNGVVIEYGKNLTDFSQEKNIADMITGIVPYWTKEDVTITLPEKAIEIENGYGYSRVIPYDFSSSFEDQPTIEELRAAAVSYLENTEQTTPKVSIKVSFVPLAQTQQYKDLAVLERVSLCDTVTIKFSALNVDAKAKIIRTVYDVLKEHYSALEIGDVATSFAQKAAVQEIKVEKTPTTAVMANAILSATQAITGSTGGYIVLDPPEHPSRILIMDMPDKATAQNVWQWNMGGLGFSSTGINGTYGTAMTADGQIVADFITTGVIASKDGNTFFDLENDTIQTKSTEQNSLGQDVELSSMLSNASLQFFGKLNGSSQYSNTGGILSGISDSSSGSVPTCSFSGNTFELFYNGIQKLFGYFDPIRNASVCLADEFGVLRSDGINDRPIITKTTSTVGQAEVVEVDLNVDTINGQTFSPRSTTINGNTINYWGW